METDKTDGQTKINQPIPSIHFDLLCLKICHHRHVFGTDQLLQV